MPLPIAATPYLVIAQAERAETARNHPHLFTSGVSHAHLHLVLCQSTPNGGHERPTLPPEAARFHGGVPAAQPTARADHCDRPIDGGLRAQRGAGISLSVFWRNGALAVGQCLRSAFALLRFGAAKWRLADAQANAELKYYSDSAMAELDRCEERVEQLRAQVCQAKEQRP